MNGGAVSEFAPPWVARAPDANDVWSAAFAFFCLGLAAVTSSPYAARHRSGVILRDWGVKPDDVSTALLLISELVTNAVKFGVAPEIPEPTEIILALWSLREALVIEVSDQSPNLPVRRSASWDAVSGRGLNLVRELSQEWHYYVPRPGWKTVYCVLAVEG